VPFLIYRLLELVYRLILVFLVALTLTACGVHISRYQYISLEDVPEIQVLEYGKADRSDIFFQGAMPIRYKLVRDRYDLYFHINTEYHSGILNTKAELATGVPLNIRGEEYPGSCAALYYGENLVVFGEGEKAVTFAWGKNFKYCHDGTYDPQKQILAFRVERDDGTVLGKERFLYRRVENGIVFAIDAI
jgi:hypothetical protein